ncbi:MAG: hypothetical protein Q9164_007250, partial [Protoblastenia rupestris]
GNVGPSILDAIDSNPHLTPSILTRESSKSTFPSHIKVHKIPNDYPEDQLITAFKGQDAVISLVPMMGDVGPHKAFINAAIKAGVKRFMPSDFGAKTNDPRVIEALPIFRGEAEIEDYLKSKESEGLTWTTIGNGTFFDW